jgi:hypothetical protein
VMSMSRQERLRGHAVRMPSKNFLSTHQPDIDRRFSRREIDSHSSQ